MKKYWLLPLLFTPLFVNAATSSTVTLASDYLFNGVSQTKEDEALQVSLDWFGKSGWYAGGWVSQVDFGDGTDVEGDLYGGYKFTLTEKLKLDVGLSQYTYHGDDVSSDYNYAEAFAKFNYGQTNLDFWYAWDYFGTGAAHGIVMLTHSIPITDRWLLTLGVDHSMSFDSDKYEWESGDDDYTHWHLTGTYSISTWSFSLGYESNDIDSYADSTFVASISKTFNF
ncbi:MULTISPECIES: TorF family putative porin [unclassified Pseudoalteromonas]|uniref:TorF family putative porin n=1 Tax=unclassified Pseudoalteromonas TaxID=194690 RepID=UPI001F24A005|nr:MULTISPECIES: TorF family putative porin [unclassified Pseudoalteromonas]MCF2827194.1 TorF family putative porin [Pseudoalteromonas sp. OF5H-5]MCF2832857.1 TorF family putative porin [Pseudoalteromonas sp. DL2-H6]MCF2926577.1 TorF family putative porin [Pseudoalteromonas sp. DL2-H1]